MLALILCALAFAGCFAAARRSVVSGLVAVAAVGYLYGIARANIPSTASHFYFDAGVGGLYVALFMRPLTGIQRHRIQAILPWVVFLAAWPIMLFFLPIQDPLIQMVGLRGQIMFLPFLLIGALLDGEELYTLALWIGALNMVAFAFAGAEWFLGVQRFYPFNAVTRLIYMSNDVGGSAHDIRIPATFVNSSAYAETMVITVPLLVGAWMQRRRIDWQRYLTIAALVAAGLGTFMAASRSHAAVLIMLVMAVTLFGRFKQRTRFVWILVIVVVGMVVATQPRLQRITTLSDTTYTQRRLHSSINGEFLELAAEYPVGNGLGGGGTSLPYFLQGRVRNPVVMENEYARIMLEEGIPGLCLWLVFIVWLLARPAGPRSDPWYLARWLARLTCAAYFAAASIGTGLLTSIPATFLLLLIAGWLAARQPVAAVQAVPTRYRVRAGRTPMRRYGW